LAINVLALFHGIECDEGMPVVGRADGDGIDILAVEELAEILVLGAVFADHAGGLLPMVGIDVADRYILAAFLTSGAIHDISALTAHPYGTHEDAVVGGDGLSLFGSSLFFARGQFTGLPNWQAGGHRS